MNHELTVSELLQAKQQLERELMVLLLNKINEFQDKCGIQVSDIRPDFDCFVTMDGKRHYKIVDIRVSLDTGL